MEINWSGSPKHSRNNHMAALGSWNTVICLLKIVEHQVERFLLFARFLLELAGTENHVDGSPEILKSHIETVEGSVQQWSGDDLK